MKRLCCTQNWSQNKITANYGNSLNRMYSLYLLWFLFCKEFKEKTE